MHKNNSRRITALMAAFAVLGSIAEAQVTTPATLSLASGAATNGVSLTVNDPYNNTWSILASTNLKNWNEVGRLKVFNGNFRTNIPINTNMPMLMYRAAYNTNEAAIVDTLAASLVLPASPYSYTPSLRANYFVPPISQQDNTPTNNTSTDAGAALGRALFYDKRLSTNQTVSCASCHQQQYGFSDPRTVSVGFNGSLGSRNAMSLSDARYYQRGHFFWDERASTLEVQVLQPIQNPIEMGMTLPALLPRLAAEPYYTNLFMNAFGSTNVTTNRISFAPAQFVRSIVSTNSKYDQGIPNFTNFTAQENTGRQLFFGLTGPATCSACHTPDTLAAANIFNNGLESPYVDLGVGGITGVSTDMGLFKVPSLRNIALTAPYMHDGRFTTLDQVVEFYNSGIVSNANLSAPLRVPGRGGGAPLRLNLTTDQKAALVAFLKTLTDTTLITDPKFSDPFNYGN